jgi:hypothetical protein
LLKNQAHKNQRKMRTLKFLSVALILIVGMILTFQGCQKDFENETIGPNLNQNAISVLGKKLINPYSVTNMQKALNNLLGKSKGSNDTIIATHLYLKFIPLNDEELDRLDSLNYISEYPLDYEVIEGESSYRDPEVPENQPTFQYTSVKIGDPLPNVSYEIIEELYIPEEDSNYSGKGNVNVDALVTEALRITDNLKGNELNNTKSSWTPSGRITVLDDFSNTIIPIRGVKVNARRWFTIHRGITDANGYFQCDGTFKRPANYSIYWERHDWDIREEDWGQAVYNGPNTQSAWNLYVGGGKSLRYAHIHRALHLYYYENNFGIHAPPQNQWYNRKLKVGYYHRNRDFNGDANPYWAHWYTWPDIRIFGQVNYSWSDSRGIFSTTLHELAHASHWALVGRNDFIDTEVIVAESWARGAQLYLTRIYYPNYQNPYNRKRYTGIVEDLIDGVKSRTTSLYWDDDSDGTATCSLSYNDSIKDYTLTQIENSLFGAFTFDQWKNNLKNNYYNETESHIDTAFNYWNTGNDCH